MHKDSLIYRSWESPRFKSGGNRFSIDPLCIAIFTIFSQSLTRLRRLVATSSVSAGDLRERGSRRIPCGASGRHESFGYRNRDRASSTPSTVALKEENGPSEICGLSHRREGVVKVAKPTDRNERKDPAESGKICSVDS